MEEQTKSDFIVKGHFRLEHYRDGLLIDDTGWIPNTTTNAGVAIMAGLFNNVGGFATFLYLAVGTSNTAVAVTDTTLGAEVVDTGLARALGTGSRVTTTVTNDTSQIVYTWTASGAKTIEEIGLFNASSGATLGAHALTGTKVMANGDQLVGTYKVKFTAG